VQKRPPIINEIIVPIEGPRQDIFGKTAVSNFEDAAASPTETAYLLRGMGISQHGDVSPPGEAASSPNFWTCDTTLKNLPEL